MGRPLTVSRQGRYTRRMNFVEELRSAMPVSQYIAMLHEGAITGRLPKFDRFGMRLPDANQDQEQLAECDRAKLITYLVDKVMPTYRQQEAPEATTGDTDAVLANSGDADFSLLSSDQLREIATAATKLADACDGDAGTSQASGGGKLASPESIPGPAAG